MRLVVRIPVCVVVVAVRGRVPARTSGRAGARGCQGRVRGRGTSVVVVVVVVVAAVVVLVSVVVVVVQMLTLAIGAPSIGGGIVPPG